MITRPPIAFFALGAMVLAACAHARSSAAPPTAQAQAYPYLRVTCADWKRNSDGSWSVRRPTLVDGPGSLTIDQKGVLKGIVVIRGRDLVADLDQRCRPL
jgi:hypothetical protein